MCTQCGGCCGRLLPVTKKDIKRIKAYVKKHDVPYEPRRRTPLEELERRSCPFLLNSKITERCSIYPMRPNVCREFDCQNKKHGKLGNTVPTTVDMYEVFNLK